jgi:hypothetical protein
VVIAKASSAPAPERSPPAATGQPFRLAWQRQTPPFNKGLALAQSGHLAVLASRRLSLHALGTGDELATAEVCFTFPAAFAFVAPTVGALVCEDAIKLFALPELGYLGRKALSDKARLAAAGGGKLAIAFATGAIRLYDVAAWTVIGELSVSARPTSLSLAPDGSRLAIGLDSGEAQIWSTAALSATPETVVVKRGFEVTSVALSDTADRLFVAAGPRVAILAVSGAEQRAFPVVQRVTSAQWLGDDGLVVIAEEALVVLDASLGSAHSLPWTGAPPVSLVVQGGAGIVCAAANEGKLACFSRGALKGGQTLPLEREPGPPGGKRMAGRITAVTLPRVQIKAQADQPMPTAGSEVLVVRYREHTTSDFTHAGWVLTARGRVVEVSQDRVVVELDGASPKEPIPPDVAALRYDTPIQLLWPPTAREPR